MSERTDKLYLSTGVWWSRSFPGTKNSKPVLMTLPTTNEPRIVQTPGVLGGAPRIAGRRVGVHHVAVWRGQLGMSVAEIAREFDLSSDDVQAAIDYYRRNRDEIDAIIRAEDVLIQEVEKQAAHLH